ncbi:septum formation initiator family protein [Euzebya sp.]|uniref:FtsB family cell division protein n=1 Tax=Euzebya sp. TaxID=1971409 RepID=UPI0035196EB1
MYLAGIAVLVLLVAFMAIGPYADYTAAQDRLATLVAEQRSLDEAVDGLEAEAERLQDPAALEEQAREDLGMARPGEVPYIVVNPPTEAPAPVNANPATDEEPSPSPVERVVDWVLAWAR